MGLSNALFLHRHRWELHGPGLGLQIISVTDHSLSIPSPTAAALAKDLRDRVVQWRIGKDLSCRKLSELAGCSIGTVANTLMYHYIYYIHISELEHVPSSQDVLGTENAAMLELLKKQQSIVKREKLRHRYPYDWKANKPIIVTYDSLPLAIFQNFILLP